MQIFTELKRFLRYVGLLEFNTPNAHKIAIILQTIALLVQIIVLLPTMAFLLFDKDAVLGDRIQCLATFLSYAYCVLVFSIFLFRKQEFLGMITVLERTIDERNRKYVRTVYTEMNDEVEQLSVKVKIFVGGLVTPMLMTPPMVVSFFNYYVRDMGAESFRLFSPMW